MSKRKVIYLVRHGQSEDNIRPVFQSVNAKLSETGQKQAHTVAQRVATLPIEQFIASPVIRAKQTAEIINKTIDMPITYSDLFVERVKPEILDGKSWDDPVYRPMYDNWTRSLYTPDMRIEDGENYGDVTARAEAALAFLQEQEAEHILLVTHGFFLRALIAQGLFGDTLSPEGYQKFLYNAVIENTSISVLTYGKEHIPGMDDGYAWRLSMLNDHSHFADS